MFPHARFVGLTFREAAIEMANEDISLLAAQVNGSILLNPTNHVITNSDVLFVITTDSKDCDKVAHNNDAEVSTWIATFDNNRRLGNVNTRLRRRSLNTVTVGNDYQPDKTSMSDITKMASDAVAEAEKKREPPTSPPATPGTPKSGGGGFSRKPTRGVSRWSIIKNAIASAETVAAKGGHTVVVMMETNENRNLHVRRLTLMFASMRLLHLFNSSPFFILHMRLYRRCGSSWS